MLPIYICEDDEMQLAHYKKLIQDILLMESFDATIVCATANPSYLLSYLSIHESPSLYFLDLELADTMDGFALAKKIREHDPRGFIVFISSHSELLPLTFDHKIEAMDYILKDNATLLHYRVQDCIDHALTLYTLPTNTIQKVIGIKIDGRTITIKLSDIYCVETSYEAHKIRIHSKTGYTELFYTLKEIRRLLDDSFFQCHKSCIINLAHVKDVDHKNYLITLDNNKSCPVATRLMRSLLSKLKI